MTGDIGPNTGCMGNVVWSIRNPDKNIFVNELKKLTPALKAMKYKGPIDLNCIADSSGVYALELTVRFGYDAIEAFHGLLNEPFGMILMEMAMGTKSIIDVRNGFSTAVRLSIPPWPHNKPEPKVDKGQPILGVSPTIPWQYLTDVYWENSMARWAASDGVLLKVVGIGDTVKTSKRLVYKHVREVRTEGLQYRTDIGDRVESDMKQLRSWRYI